MEKRYWSYMNQVRFTIYCMDLYADQAHKWDLRMNVICAVASSGSIAAWALWQQSPLLWAFILAVSHVINAVRPFLPYSARLKNIEPSQKDMKLLYNKMEHDWFLVSSGKLTEQEINDRLHQYQNEYVEIESRGLKQDVLKHDLNIQRQAQERTDAYVKLHFDYDAPGE